MTLTAIVRGWIMLKNDIISERREYVRNQILKSKFCGVHLNKGVTKQYTKIKNKKKSTGEKKALKGGWFGECRLSRNLEELNFSLQSMKNKYMLAGGVIVKMTLEKRRKGWGR